MIDFVVTWLNSSDKKWQQQFAYYKEKNTGRTETARFRNMDIFRYWFRAVEQYAPWVNKIFLVTNGTFPEWINEDHPKLVLVKHSDYIPEKYLPTFNSYTIEAFLHKIKGLSEQFVYFNDDFFLNAPVSPENYFRNGLPCDNNAESMMKCRYNSKDKYGIYLSILATIGVINAYFDRRNTVRLSLRRWYGFHLGKLGLVLSFMLRHSSYYIGFRLRHFEQPLLKSTLEDAWEKASEQLEASCTKFRKDTQLVVPYFFRYWQFASNRFCPVRLYKSRIYNLRLSKLKGVERTLNSPAFISVCLNDTADCPDDEYKIISCELQRMLNQKFPLKSSFER